MKKLIVVAALIFLTSQAVDAEDLKAMEERIRQRLAEGTRELEKVCRGPLNAVLVFYEKRPVETWVERCSLEAFVRHAVTEKKRAHLILDGLTIITGERDRYYALERADTCAGIVISDAKALVGILRTIYIPGHKDVHMWTTLAGAGASGQKIFGSAVFELEEKLDFILRYELNLLGNLSDAMGEEGDNLKSIIAECGAIYFKPRFEAYELFKKTLNEKKELNRGEKIMLAKEIEKFFEAAIAEMEPKLQGAYRAIKLSPMLRTRLDEGVKR